MRAWHNPVLLLDTATVLLCQMLIHSRLSLSLIANTCKQSQSQLGLQIWTHRHTISAARDDCITWKTDILIVHWKQACLARIGLVPHTLNTLGGMSNSLLLLLEDTWTMHNMMDHMQVVRAGKGLEPPAVWKRRRLVVPVTEKRRRTRTCLQQLELGRSTGVPRAVKEKAKASRGMSKEATLIVLGSRSHTLR